MWALCLKATVAARLAQNTQLCDRLITAAKEDDAVGLERLLTEPNAPNVNCVDKLGNTALHWAALRGHHRSIVVLLENGADVMCANTSGRTPLDLVGNPQTLELLKSTRGPPMRDAGRVHTASA